MVVEKITIVTEMIDKATNKLRKVSEATRTLDRFQGIQIDTTQRLNRATNRQNIIMRKTTRGVKSFNFAWLSVMFAGMALNRVFGGLIKTQLQLFGVTELFAGVLTVVMLPVMEMLLPLFLQLADIFFNLPEGVKLAIGVFVILMFVFGTILLVVGQVMLAVGGFALLMSGPAVAAIITFGIIVLGIVLILIGFVIFMIGMSMIIKNWGKDWKEVGKGIVLVLAGIALAVIGILILIGLLPVAWALVGVLIVAAVALMAFWIISHWEEIKEVWEVTWAFMVNLTKKGANGIVGIVGWLVNKIINFLNKIPGINIAPIDFEKFKMELEDMDALVRRINAQRKEREDAAEVLKQETENEGGFLNKIIPEDFKGLIPATGNEGETKQEINISTENTFNVSDKEEMEKMLNENNIKLVEEVKRQIDV